MKKEHLDIPICEIERQASNTETYREFIQSSEEEFGMDPASLDELTDEELKEYIDFLDYLWEK
jgi:hypothetical protein